MNESVRPAGNTGIASQPTGVMNRSSAVPSTLSTLGSAFENSSPMSNSGTQIHPATMERMQSSQDYSIDVYNDTDSFYSYSSYASYNNSDILSSHYNKIMTALYIALPILVAAVGIIGNSTVIYIIIRHRDMHTVTNYFLANLAATDVVILTLCAIPSAVASPTAELPISVCKGINYVMFVSVQATCLTLTAMTIDRYNLIVHAVKSRKTRTIRKTLITNVLIWAGSFILQSPVAITSEIGDDKACNIAFPTKRGSNAFHIFTTLSMYAIPLVIILVCYVNILVQVWRKAMQGTESAQAQERSIRRKRKITRMVFIIVFLYAVCWLPSHVFRLWKEFDPKNLSTIQFSPYYEVAFLFSQCLVYVNSCVNPFVYAFTTTSFKKHFKRLFASCCQSAQSAVGSVSTFKLSKFTRDDESI